MVFLKGGVRQVSTSGNVNLNGTLPKADALLADVYRVMHTFAWT